MRKPGTRINTKVVSDILTGEILERRSYMHRGAVARAMGVRNSSGGTNTFIGPLPANATETIIYQVGPLVLPIDNAQVFLQWFFSYTPGTANSSAQFNIRRGTTTAATRLNINNWQNQTVAAQPFYAGGCYVDQPGVAGSLFYILTIVQIAATAAGTAVDGAFMAMIL